jgi:hypothetical protein
MEVKFSCSMKLEPKGVRRRERAGTGPFEQDGRFGAETFTEKYDGGGIYEPCRISGRNDPPARTAGI